MVFHSNFYSIVHGLDDTSLVILSAAKVASLPHGLVILSAAKDASLSHGLVILSAAKDLAR